VNVSSLSCLTTNERAAIAAYIAQLDSQFPGRVLSVTLFGSKARGDADAESDIDLLVLVDTRDYGFRSELWRIASDISLEYNVVLSARVFAQSHWAEIKRIRPPLYRAVAADGIPLTFDKTPLTSTIAPYHPE
jgi:predicted nucleotidyltransferase